MIISKLGNNLDPEKERYHRKVIQVIDTFKKFLTQRKVNGAEVPEDLMERAEELLDLCIEEELFSKALQFCDVLLSIEPYSTSLLAKKGEILIGLMNYDEAFESLQIALSLDPTSNYVLQALLRLFLLQRDNSKALQLIEKLSCLHPSEDLLFCKAKVLHESGSQDEALEILLQLLDSEEMAPYALNEIGQIYFFQGKVNESIEFYRKALDKIPDDPWFWYNLSVSFLKLGRYFRALDCAINVVTLDPQWAPGYLLLGKIYANLGRYKQALHSFRKYLNIEWDPEVCFYVAVILAELGRYREAVSVFKLLKSEKYVNTIYNSFLAYCYFQLNEVEKFSEEFRFFLKLNPNAIEKQSGFFFYLVASGFFELALQILKSALLVNTENSFLIGFTLFLALYSQKYRQMIEMLEEVYPTSKMPSKVDFALGVLKIMIGNIDAGVKHFSKSINNDKEYFSIAYQEIVPKLFSSKIRLKIEGLLQGKVCQNSLPLD
ncbi:MAG: tetratricopeptide repeat protein [Ignavibacteria bacterium]|nr:tetratricopeptide repeat protein [Ignavibacteria bacterium]